MKLSSVTFVQAIDEPKANSRAQWQFRFEDGWDIDLDLSVGEVTIRPLKPTPADLAHYKYRGSGRDHICSTVQNIKSYQKLDANAEPVKRGPGRPPNPKPVEAA